jgi:hypothetical protein
MSPGMAEHESTEGPEAVRTGPVEHDIIGDNEGSTAHYFASCSGFALKLYQRTPRLKALTICLTNGVHRARYSESRWRSGGTSCVHDGHSANRSTLRRARSRRRLQTATSFGSTI